ASVDRAWIFGPRGGSSHPCGSRMLYGDERDIPVRYRSLARIVGLLSRVQGVREELVEEIRSKLQNGEYLTEERLNEAIYRLLREIMA
ncbi:MAG: flagellar biosynthesis anti-sigma factor FlgM, partial [Planctomycetota bacterium]